MSGERVSRAHIKTAVLADPKKRIPPFLADFNGDVLKVHQANLILVGSTGDDDLVPTAVSVVTGISGCGCGCRNPGYAIAYSPTTEEARRLAAQLIEAADEVDAAAKASADALLNRARGR